MTTVAVSVTEFKTHCLDLIRQVEQGGDAVELTRHGKVVARLIPTAFAAQGTPAWQRLRGQGKLLAAAGSGIDQSASQTCICLSTLVARKEWRSIFFVFLSMCKVTARNCIYIVTISDAGASCSLSLDKNKHQLGGVTGNE